MPRSLAATLRAQVPATSRQRGDGFFHAGRVHPIEATPTHYRAIVRGANAYTVIFCATDRFFVRLPESSGAPPGASIPIRWDPLPAMFRLSVRRTSDGFTIEATVLHGNALRPLSDARFVTSSVILWTADDGGAMHCSPFDARGGDAWLNQLLSTGSVTVPASATALLAEILVTSGLTHVEIPDELRVSVGTTAPTPIVRLTRSDPFGGYYARDRVTADLSFQYGTCEVDADETGPVIFGRQGTAVAYRADALLRSRA